MASNVNKKLIFYEQLNVKGNSISLNNVSMWCGTD